MQATYYTLNEAARLLKVHPQTLRRWIRGGRLSACRVGKQYRLTPGDLENAGQPVEAARNGRANELAGFEKASLAGLDEVWDNEADAIYDNWRRLYDLPEG